MLRYALRRMLWLFPSVLGVSLISFFVLSLIPVEPLPSQTEQESARAEAERRHRFLDLPLFFNVDPLDVRARAVHAVESLVAAPPAGQDESAEASRARRELTRLGGAALPVVLPLLDSLPPHQRSRVALALAPIAERMGLSHEGEPSDPERVVVFWNRFWESRGVEFREATARSAVRRYVEYGTESRAAEIRVLDTFALAVVMEALEPPEDVEGIEPARRLVGLLAQATERDDRIAAEADVEAARAVVERWRRWWLVYRADFVHLAGAERVAAFVLESRYGKWVYETAILRLGKDVHGQPLLEQLRTRAQVTFGVLLLGLVIAYTLAIPLGSVAALFANRPGDRVISGLSLLPYAISPAALASLAMLLAPGLDGSLVAAAVLLGLTLLADPLRHQRAQLLSVLAQDYVRAAEARGARPLRVMLVHGMRNALLPVLTRSTLELPLALTACFVLERIFDLRGLGAATVNAVHDRDTSFLMALAVLGAAWAVTSLVLNDAGYALLDPRMRERLLRLRGRRT